jgi:hypothetical protein
LLQSAIRHLTQREIVWPFAALGSMRIALCRCLPDDPVRA